MLRSSIQVRETIELLCRILAENGTTPIRAEILRKAKFNSLEESTPLWQLLYELIRLCENGCINTQTPVTLTTPLAEEHVTYVKKEMQKRGYLCLEFANLPASFRHGSQELLLAFAWLLFKEDIIGRFTRNHMSSVHSDLLSLFENVEDNSTHKTCGNHDEKHSSTAAHIQQLLTLNHKLQMYIRLLHASHLEYARLSYKVHSATYGVFLTPGHTHLSTKETYCLRYPKEMKKMLLLLKQDSSRMENLLLWGEKEHMFWEWMESVVELKEYPNTDFLLVHNPESAIYTDVPPSVLTDIVARKKSVAETILRHELTIERLESLSGKVNLEDLLPQITVIMVCACQKFKMCLAHACLACGAQCQEATLNCLELNRLLKSVGEEVMLLQSCLGQEILKEPFICQGLTSMLVKNSCGNNKHAAKVSNVCSPDNLCDDRVQLVHVGLKQLNEEKCILAEDLRLLHQHFLQQLNRTGCATLSAVCVIPNCLRRRSVKPLSAQTS